MDRSSKMKINKETEALNDTTDQIDLIDIYRTFHPKTAHYTFFSSACKTFSRIDHILDHKSSLSKFKKTEIISSIFSDHNAIRLGMNYRGKKCKKHKHMESKQHSTKEPMGQRDNFKIPDLRPMKMERQHSKIYGYQQRQF